MTLTRHKHWNKHGITSFLVDETSTIKPGTPFSQVRDSPELVPEQSSLTLDTRKNGSLLDGRGLLKTIGIDATEKGLREVHVIKAVNDLIPVTLQNNNNKKKLKW